MVEHDLEDIGGTEGRRVGLLGYFGFGNLGDEAILAASVRGFRCASPGVTLVALSARPEETAKAHGVTSISRTDRKAIARTLRAGDLFVLCGGSLLQDATSLKSLIYYVGISLWQYWRGLSVVLMAQGIGPLNSRMGRMLVRLLLRRVSYASVRDGDSAKWLRRFGVPADRWAVTADPVFAWPAVPKTSPVRRRVLIALRPVPDMGFLLAVEAACQWLLSEGAELILFPLRPEQDLDLAETLRARLGGGRVVLPMATMDENLELFASCDLVIALRLHALIFAALCAVPFVALAYDPKVLSLCRELGVHHVFDLTPDRQRLLKSVQGLWREGGAERAHLAAQRAVLAERAQQNFNLVLGRSI